MQKLLLVALIVAGMLYALPALFSVLVFILVGVGLFATARMLVRLMGTKTP